MIPGHIHLKNVYIWFQDEARFGQRNTTTKIWAEKGTRPRAVQQQQFEYAYLFGAVCINTGQTEALVMPFSNSEVMKAHLRLISDATPKGKHAVVIMVRASWHQSYLAEEFTNLTIIHLPPYSPELNSIEQVWHGCETMKSQTDALTVITILSINVVMLGIASVKAKIESSHNVIEIGLIWKLNYRNWYNQWGYFKLGAWRWVEIAHDPSLSRYSPYCRTKGWPLRGALFIPCSSRSSPSKALNEKNPVDRVYRVFPY